MANLKEIVRSTLDPLMKGLEQRVENLEESKKILQKKAMQIKKKQREKNRMMVYCNC